MVKILFISFEFHPVQTTGNFRAANLVKYFGDEGIEPIVLCGEEASIIQYFRGGRINNNLLSDIPENCKVYRVPFDKPYKPASKYGQIKYYADPIHSFWKKNAFNKAVEIIGQNPDIKAIVVSMPPFSVGELALKVSKKFKIPLFLDLRDAWSNQGQFPFFTRVHYLMNLFKERALLRHATGIITVTNQLADIYLHSHKGIAKEKMKVVYNSFDRFDAKSQPPVTLNRIAEDKKYIVGYIGAFYFSPEAELIKKTTWWKRSGFRKLFYYAVQEDWRYRSPYYFFKLMSLFFEKYPHFRKSLFFGHIGDTPSWLYEMADTFGVKDNIISYGFVNKDELVNVVEEFSALLATTEKIPGNKSFCLPSKTFDYIKYGKPIFGLVKEGDYTTFLKKINMGVMLDPDNLEKELSVMESFLLSGETYKPDANYINSFHAKEQTKLFSNIIKATLSEHAIS